MIKKIFIFIFLISLNSCGYSPIYSISKNVDFVIVETEFEGDRNVNNILKSKFKRYSLTKGEKFNIDVSSSYEKIATSKDSAGKITIHRLDLNVTIKVRSDNFYKQYNYNESFSLKNSDDQLEINSYESSIKKNMTNRVFDKFILDLINR